MYNSNKTNMCISSMISTKISEFSRVVGEIGPFHTPQNSKYWLAIPEAETLLATVVSSDKINMLVWAWSIIQ